MPPAGNRAPTAIEQNIQRVIAGRKRLGERLLVTFKTNNEQLQQVLEECTSTDWELPCYHPDDILPVRTLVDLRLGELVIHAWDIRSRLESTAALSAESATVLMERIQARFGAPGYSDFRLASQYTAPVCYRFELTGALASTQDIIVESGRARLERSRIMNPQVTLRCDTDVFVLLMYCRLSLDVSLATGLLVVEGRSD